MSRFFGRRSRNRRVQPQGYTPSGAIERQIDALRRLAEEGYLEEDAVRPVIDELLTTGTDEAVERFRRQASTLIQRGMDRQQQELDQQEPQGETKTQSRYATQPEVPAVPEEEVVAETKAVEVQDDTPVVEPDPYTYRVHSMPVARASPLLEVVRTIQSEM